MSNLANVLPQEIAYRENVFLRGETDPFARNRAGIWSDVLTDRLLPPVSDCHALVKKRALHGFVFIRDDRPIDILELEIVPGFWSGVTVLGYAASLQGDDCLGIQTGYWQRPYSNSYLYLRIRHVESLKWLADPSFRKNTPCLWLTAKEGEYALMRPFDFYEILWKRTLISYRPWDSNPYYHDTDLTAGVPDWWPDHLHKRWEQFCTDVHAPLKHHDDLLSATMTPSHDAESIYEPSARPGPAPVIDRINPMSENKDSGKRVAQSSAASQIPTSEDPELDQQLTRTFKRIRLGEQARERQPSLPHSGRTPRNARHIKPYGNLQGSEGAASSANSFSAVPFNRSFQGWAPDIGAFSMR
ncbi:hypothetical protein BDV93DRAFT_513030 [Ceratobasidium sp. AG-I]|nr:hypothetical protein BDV93DRAFT_513030 [Ceratobasidium sp. AG-I]